MFQLIVVGSMSDDTTTSSDLDRLPDRDQFRIFWGFLWRAIAIGLGCTLSTVILAVVAGIVIGIFGRILGLHDMKYGHQVVGFVIGALVGVIGQWFLLSSLFYGPVGGYRFRLEKASGSQAQQGIQPDGPASGGSAG